MNDVVVQDSAHCLQSNRSVGFIDEESPVVRRRSQDVAPFVQTKRVNLYLLISSFEEENGHVIRREFRSPIANVHPHTVEQMITVCLDYQLSIAPGYLAREGT